MSNSLAEEKSPRIASYTVPRDIWLLCGLIVVAAVCLRFVPRGGLHQAAEVAFFVTAVVNLLNFVIPLATPKSILGGAKLKSLVLALFALTAWISNY
jgi:CBS-domain-containing membrane protein